MEGPPIAVTWMTLDSGCVLSQFGGEGEKGTKKRGTCIRHSLHNQLFRTAKGDQQENKDQQKIGKIFCSFSSAAKKVKCTHG